MSPSGVVSSAAISESDYSVDPTTGCWLWLGTVHTVTKYAMLGRKLAHRVAYEQFVGPVPEGLQIDHVWSRGCRHRHCVNPDHLEPVTRKENILRGQGITAQEARQTHCLRGHPLSGENLALYGGQRKCRKCHNDNTSQWHKSARAKAKAHSKNDEED